MASISISTIVRATRVTLVAVVAILQILGHFKALAAADHDCYIAWRNLHTTSKSITVEWTEEREETDIDLLAKLAAEQSVAPSSLPVMAYSQSKKLMLLGEWYRYSYKGDRPIGGKVRPQSIELVFDGTKRIDFAREYEAGGHPSANIYARGDSHVANVGFLPIVLLHRPFDARLGGVPSEPFQRRARPEKVQGHDCEVIATSASTKGRFFMLWVDLHQSWLPRRVQVWKRDTLQSHIDISYADMGRPGVPTSWRIVSYRAVGVPDTVISATVTKWDTSTVLSQQEFLVEFPIGTTVANYTEKTEQAYIVKDDGNRRILPSEMGLDHETLMTSSTGQAGVGSGSYRGWLLVLGATLLASGVVVLYVRWRLTSEHR